MTVSTTPPRNAPALTRATTWFAVAVIVVFGARAVGTLAAGADWSLPGTGWRSLWQLAVVAVAVTTLARPGARFIGVAAIGAVYAAATLAELAGAMPLLGAIPVDMRDRWVHPLVAILAAAALLVDHFRARQSAVGADRRAAPTVTRS
ncbi:MAG: hypothetical protein QM658_10275 [Gordonia sp. (in: high G+C Gram-positive bacteria)]